MTELFDAYSRLAGVRGAVTKVELGAIRASDYRKFAYAVGDVNPRYFDDDPISEAPLIFLTAVMGWDAGPVELELRVDGTVPAATAGLPLDGLRLMGAGQDLEFHGPVLDGQHVTMEVSVESVALKEGSSGPLMVLTLLREYVDAAGELLVTCHENFIAR